jgi:hypothetical protein
VPGLDVRRRAGLRPRVLRFDLSNTYVDFDACGATPAPLKGR